MNEGEHFFIAFVVLLLVSGVVAGITAEEAKDKLLELTSSQRTAAWGRFSASQKQQVWELMGASERDRLVQDGVLDEGDPPDIFNEYIQQKYDVDFAMSEGVDTLRFDASSGEVMNGRASLDLAEFAGASVKVVPLSGGGFEIRGRTRPVKITASSKPIAFVDGEVALPRGSYLIDGKKVDVLKTTAHITTQGIRTQLAADSGVRIDGFMFDTDDSYSVDIMDDDLSTQGPVRIKASNGDVLTLPGGHTFPVRRRDDGFHGVVLHHGAEFQHGGYRVHIRTPQPVAFDYSAEDLPPQGSLYYQEEETLHLDLSGEVPFFRSDLRPVETKTIAEVGVEQDGAEHRYYYVPYTEPESLTILVPSGWTGSYDKDLTPEGTDLLRDVNNPRGAPGVRFEIGEVVINPQVQADPGFLEKFNPLRTGAEYFEKITGRRAAPVK